jgi:hypothetical protein
MKDMNFIEINRDIGYSLIDLNVMELDEINEIIESDSEFLSSEGLMDYSLLMVLESLSKSDKRKSFRKSKADDTSLNFL